MSNGSMMMDRCAMRLVTMVKHSSVRGVCVGADMAHGTPPTVTDAARGVPPATNGHGQPLTSGGVSTEPRLCLISDPIPGRDWLTHGSVSTSSRVPRQHTLSHSATARSVMTGYDRSYHTGHHPL